MKVLVPTPVTTAALLADNVPEADASEWSNNTSYAADAKVMKVASHRIYQAAVPSNGVDPEGDTTGHWVDIAPTNRWAMFDQVVGTATVGTGVISLSLAAGSVGSLAVIDTDADTVRVQVIQGGASIYDVTQATNAGGDQIQDWEAYFFDDVGKVMSLIFEGLPSYPDAQINVTITGADATGPVSVGTLLVGNMAELGSTEVGASVGIIDYSRKATDDFGVTTVVERAWSKKMTARSMIATAQAASIQRRLAALRATPALWIGEDGHDELAVYGFFKDFTIDLPLANISYVSFTIEGLI
jgi:hypothetical protein